MLGGTDSSSLPLDVLLPQIQQRTDEEDPASARLSSVDLGTVGMSEKRDLHFYVRNDNPVPLHMLSWNANVSWCDVQLIALLQSDSQWISLQPNSSESVSVPIIFSDFSILRH